MKFTAEIEKGVRGIGTDVTQEFKLSASRDVQAAMYRWMAEVIKLTTEGIDKVDAKATLNLRQSVGFAELPTDAKIAQVAMEMATYWKFVEYGVNGVRGNRGSPFSFRSLIPSQKDIDDIRKWTIDKGLSIPIEEIDQASYNIARAIKRRGIKGRPFLNPVLTEDRINALMVSIAEVAGKEISLSINL